MLPVEEAQDVGFEEVAVINGVGLTVTVEVMVVEQRVAAKDATMVYSVVVVGFASTVFPLVVLSPVAGDQLMASAAPFTVSVTFSPLQMVGLFTLTCGRGFTMILKLCAALVHPLCVAVTVMVAVC